MKTGQNGHLEETLRRILAEAIATEIDDPRVGFVTVSEVRLNRDHTVAQVFYTVMGDEEDHRATQRGLRQARGYLRQILGDRTRMRKVPELRFRYDASLDRSFRLEAVFDELDGQPDQGSTDEGPERGSEGASE
jgi:ribosome-binding factor A